MKADELPAVEGCRLAVLGEADIGALQELLQRCADFEILVTGAPPGPDAAAELLAAAPPGLPPERKRVVGIWTTEGLVGAIDLLRDYPACGVWYLGLLLLAPEARSSGLGAQIYVALATWIASQDGERVRLVVQQQNTRGMAFWRRMGFQEAGHAAQAFAAQANLVRIMEHQLRA